MHSVFLPLIAAGLATFAHAYTKPGANTWGPLLTPDLTNVRWFIFYSAVQMLMERDSLSLRARTSP